MLINLILCGRTWRVRRGHFCLIGQGSLLYCPLKTYRRSVHLFNHPFIHSLNHHLFIYSFIHSSIHSFIHLFIKPPIHAFIHSTTHSIIHSSNLSFSLSHCFLPCVSKSVCLSVWLYGGCLQLAWGVKGGSMGAFVPWITKFMVFPVLKALLKVLGKFSWLFCSPPPEIPNFRPP